MVLHSTYRKHILLISLWVMILPIIGFSQSNNHTLPESRIADLREIIKYDATKKNLVPRKFEKKEERKRELKPIGAKITGNALRYLLYLGIIVLVVVIIFILFSNIKVEKKLDAIEALDLNEIEDIETIDAKSGLELALEANNYREAVRMLFIQLLQVLVLEDSIIWKPKKTNRDYLNEMSNHEKVMHFRNLVMAYERVWYGSEDIDRAFFDVLRKDFEKFYSTTDFKIDHAG